VRPGCRSRHAARGSLGGGQEIRLTLAVNASTLPHFTKAASCGETPDASSVMLARRCERYRTEQAAYLADTRYSLPFIGICVAYLGGGAYTLPSP
jgi:hypothetical protein